MFSKMFIFNFSDEAGLLLGTLTIYVNEAVFKAHDVSFSFIVKQKGRSWINQITGIELITLSIDGIGYHLEDGTYCNISVGRDETLWFEDKKMPFIRVLNKHGHPLLLTNDAGISRSSRFFERNEINGSFKTSISDVRTLALLLLLVEESIGNWIGRQGG